MSHAITPGQTLTALGTLFLPGYLSIEGNSGGGGPGGTGLVGTSALVINGGTVTVAGGGPVAHDGQRVGSGTLLVDGTLANAGLIDLTGGAYGPGAFSGGGGYLLDSGTISNTGTILIGIGRQIAGETFDGRGGVFEVTGVLLNQATLIVQAGVYGNSGIVLSYQGGSLFNDGNIINAGLLTLSGGGVSGLPGVDGGNGGVFSSEGTLTNTGTFVLEGGAGATLLSAHGGGGGYAYTHGTIFNVGTMLLAGGEAGLETHVGGGFGFGGGYGARMEGETNFVNSGVLIVGAGASAATRHGIAGWGAEAVIGSYPGLGSFSNAGTIVIDGAGGNPIAQVADHYSGSLAVETTMGYNTGLIELGGSGTNEYNGGVFSTREDFSSNTLVNSGTISIGVETAPGGASGQFSNGATLKLVGGSIVQSGAGYSHNMVLNFGTITGHGVIDVSSITNGGLIAASAGLLSVSANISDKLLFGTGRFAIDPGATLSLSGTIADNQSLSLASTGTLIATALSASIRINSPEGGNLVVAGGGTTTLNATDTDLTVTLADPTTLTLSLAGFITAIGSTGADTIIAEAQKQTLEGNGGGDTLIGYAGDGDSFVGTAAQLNGDTVGNFSGTDVIDVTDLLPGPDLVLAYSQGVGQGTLTLSEGARSTSITLLGSFTQSQFTLTSDGAAGVLVHTGR